MQMCWCEAIKLLVRALVVVEGEVLDQDLTQFVAVLGLRRYRHCCFTLRQRRSMKALSVARPLPSTLILMPSLSSALVNSSLVNCCPDRC